MTMLLLFSRQYRGYEVFFKDSVFSCILKYIPANVSGLVTILNVHYKKVLFTDLMPNKIQERIHMLVENTFKRQLYIQQYSVLIILSVDASQTGRATEILENHGYTLSVRTL